MSGWTHDFLESISRRVYYSSTCTLFYVIMTVANIGLITWVFADKNHATRPAFIALEVFVTVMLILEIVIRIVVMRKKFWHECWNVFDFIVCILCVALFIYYIIGPASGEKIGSDIVAEIGLLLRNGLQCLRMLLWLRFMRHSRARTEAFQLEVGDPEFSEADFDTAEDAAMLGLTPVTSSLPTMAAAAAAVGFGPSPGRQSKKSTPEKPLWTPSRDDAIISTASSGSASRRPVAGSAIYSGASGDDVEIEMPAVQSRWPRG